MVTEDEEEGDLAKERDLKGASFLLRRADIPKIVSYTWNKSLLMRRRISPRAHGRARSASASRAESRLGKWCTCSGTTVDVQSAPPGRTVGGERATMSRALSPAVRAWGSRRTSRKRTPAVPSTAGRRGMPGYTVSQQRRKLIEQVFGWMKTVGGLRKLRHRGGDRVDWIVTFTAAAYNLIRLRTLLARPA